MRGQIALQQEEAPRRIDRVRFQVQAADDHQGVLIDLDRDLRSELDGCLSIGAGLDRVPIVKLESRRGPAPGNLARQAALHVPALHRELRDRGRGGRDGIEQLRRQRSVRCLSWPMLV